MAGRPRAYESNEKLRKAVDKYFASITREKTLTEKKETDQLDKYGHVIYEDVPIINRLGKPVTVTEFVYPPTIADLCDFLHIEHSCWANYANPDKHPEFVETITYVRGRMRDWNEKELLMREGKNINGIIFNLENNYGYRERTQVSVNGSLEQYLSKLEEAGEGQMF